MTHSASEVFTMQLARAGAKQANRFLMMRGLQKSDRDDVIAGALLWCWQNREKYDPLIAQLDMWFMRAVRHSWDSWRAKELPTSSESLDNMGGGDDTYNIVAAEDSAAAIVRELPPRERRVASLTMQGYSKSEMSKMGIREIDIKESRASVKRLRHLLPDASTYAVIIRTPPAPNPDDGADDEDLSDTGTPPQVSSIDRALAKLDFAPPAGKDCPPCWRCMWFEGFMPDGKRDTRMAIEDLDVREAVRVTESRKIEIAQQVRDGL
jgi:hypothetical protein